MALPVIASATQSSTPEAPSRKKATFLPSADHVGLRMDEPSGSNILTILPSLRF
ncbi:hypothetical protein D3C80_1736650 [compost metagenome]